MLPRERLGYPRRPGGSLTAVPPSLVRPGIRDSKVEPGMKLPGQDRYDYSSLPERPVYEWPNGSRLAFTLCNNIELFAYRAGLGSDNAVVGAAQTQRNYAWRDYGNRVGIWNCFDLLDEYDLPGRTTSMRPSWMPARRSSSG